MRSLVQSNHVFMHFFGALAAKHRRARREIGAAAVPKRSVFGFWLSLCKRWYLIKVRVLIIVADPLLDME